MKLAVKCGFSGGLGDLLTAMALSHFPASEVQQNSQSQRSLFSGREENSWAANVSENAAV
jgi:hypothetical protein